MPSTSTVPTGLSAAPGPAWGRRVLLRQRGAVREPRPAPARGEGRPRAEQRGAGLGPGGPPSGCAPGRAVLRPADPPAGLGPGGLRGSHPARPPRSGRRRRPRLGEPSRLALLLAGALDAVVDVAQNAHGLRVQRAYGRSILNAFHGLWSVGAVTGGLPGSGRGRSRHPAPGAPRCRRARVRGGRPCWGPRVPAARSRRRRPRRAPSAAWRTATAHSDACAAPALLTMAALGVLAAAGAFVEDAGASWMPLYLRGELTARGRARRGSPSSPSRSR